MLAAEPVLVSGGHSVQLEEKPLVVKVPGPQMEHTYCLDIVENRV